MAQRVASIQAWDMMDQVVIKAHVRTYEGPSEHLAEEPISVSAQYDSTGEDDAHRWLRDALIALAETL